MNSSATQNFQTPRRKISYEAKQSVDEILQVVADQGRKRSLSGADYRIQKRLERMASQSEMDSEESFDDASSFTTGSDTSNASSSPPPTRDVFTSFSWNSEGSTRVRRPSGGRLGDRIPSGRGFPLPPLDPIKLKRPSRPPPGTPSRGVHMDVVDDHVEVKRPPRPASARGPRTVNRIRVPATMN